MIILTAGHTGPNSGAQCAATQFDEGAETIWLRNRVAEILTNKYGLVVLMDDDTASLKLLTKALTEDLALTDDLSLTECTENTEDAVASPALKSVEICRATLAQQESSSLSPEGKKSFQSVQSVGDEKSRSEKKSVNQRSLSLWRKNSVYSVSEKENSVRSEDFVIDLHFNAHSNPNARGTETIISDNANDTEIFLASKFAHITAQTLEIPLRSIKSESQTPHKRLAMLHIKPNSIILEVCFCSSPEDVEAYRKHRHKLAGKLAQTIAKLIKP